MQFLKYAFFWIVMPLLLLEATTKTIILISDSATAKKLSSFANYSWPYSTDGWIMRDLAVSKDPARKDQDGMYERHPTRGWTPKSNLTRWSEGYKYTTNSFGHRSLLEPDLAKIRVMLLGDSQTFGEEVDDSFVLSNIAQSRANKYSFINLAVGGYGFDQMYITFDEEYGKWRPSYVVFLVIPDDFVRVGYKYRSALKPFFELGPDKSDIRNFDIVRIIPNGDVIREVEHSWRYYLRHFSVANISFGLFDRHIDRTQTASSNAILIKKMMYSVLTKTQASAKVSLIYLSSNFDENSTNAELNSPSYKLFQDICGEFSRDGLSCADTILPRSKLTGFRTSAGHYFRLGNEVAAQILLDSVVRK